MQFNIAKYLWKKVVKVADITIINTHQWNAWSSKRCFLFFYFRYGSRIDVQNGRSARRQPTFSGRRVLCCQHTVCLTFRLRPRWATVFALFMPTTRAGPRRGCPESHSCRYRLRWADSRRWHSPCPSAVSELAPHQTPWAFPAAYRQMVPVFNRICINPHFQGWCPLHSRVQRVWAAPLSCAARRTVTCGEGLVSLRCAVKHLSTPFPWVSPNLSIQDVFSVTANPKYSWKTVTEHSGYEVITVKLQIGSLTGWWDPNKPQTMLIYSRCKI